MWVELQSGSFGKVGDEKFATFSPPAGFTEEEHRKMLRAVERLRHKRYPLMIKSSHGASLISESGLASERIRLWLQAAGYKPRTIELSGLEVWEDACGTEAKTDGPSCGSCSAALEGDKSAIRCDPCRYLARGGPTGDARPAVEVAMPIHQGQGNVIAKSSA